MREIKFRAWNKRKKILENVFSLDFKTVEGPIIVTTVGENTANDRDYIINFELMQYTGLKDKNGKEIYEGDIIKGLHPQDLEKREFIGRVFYWDEEGAFYHEFHKDRPPKRMWEYVEVIGNIYENPGLLEK
jgi:uncharacterized phage protein (TIGR01671 family)